MAKPYHSLKCLLLLQLALGLLLGLCRYASMRVYKQSSELDFQFHTLAQEKIGRGRGPQQPLLLVMICFLSVLLNCPVQRSINQHINSRGYLVPAPGASAKLGASASCSFSSSKLYGSKEGLQLVFLNWVCPAFQYSILIKKNIYIYISRRLASRSHTDNNTHSAF